MNKKLIFSLALTFLLTSIATATTLDVPVNYATIQAAINAAVAGDEVVVADGVYFGSGYRNLDFSGKAITVRSANGPANCILDCGGAGNRAFYFHNGETPASVVQGFTIKNGNAGTTGSLYYGGAIECEEASPTIDNCIIKNNTALYGGAIDCFYASPVITNCIITNNSSTYYGSAIECESESSPEITNCLFASNTTSGYGTIDCYDSSSPVIINCTIANNTGNGGFGGVYADSVSHPTIRNSILWNNGDDISGSGVTASYSCIQDSDEGDHIIHTDPMLRAGPSGNYYLSNIAAGQLANSPCVNGGGDTVTTLYNPWNLFTTRTDYVPDDPNTAVDMGFHYPSSGTAVQYKLISKVDTNGAGTIDPNYPAPGQDYIQFSEIRLQATPVSGYKVMQWIDADTATYNPGNPSTYHTTPGPNDTFVITMNTNKTVIVKFSAIGTYKLITYVTSGNGTLSPRSHDLYPKGTTVELTATPDEGYRVKAWGGDASNIPAFNINTNSVVMNADKTVSVAFEIDQSNLIVVRSGDVNGIQNAIDLANSGDTVQIPSGTYTATDFWVYNKSITILGDPEHPENVVIDGTGENSRGTVGFRFEGSGATCVLNGVTIANIHIGGHYTAQDSKGPDKPGGFGGWNDGQALFVLGNHQILNCIIRNVISAGDHGGKGFDGNSIIHNGSFGGNGGSVNGGAVVVYGGSPVFKNCIIEDCCAIGGNGGNGANGYNYTSDTDPNNGGGGQGGLAGYAFGGGIACMDGSNPTFENCTVRNCHTKGGRGGNGGDSGYSWGGGSGYGGLTTVAAAGQGNIISNNSARGGGVYIGKGCNAKFINCTVTDNTTEGSISGKGGLNHWGWRQQPLKNYHLPSFGAGVFCDQNSTVKFSNCSLQSNHTPSDSNDFSGGAGVGLWFVHSAQVNDCNFTLNSAPIGGGIYSFWTNLNVRDCNISDNNSYSGGGIYALNSNVEIGQSLIKGNNASTQPDSNANYALYGSGGGVYALASMININDTTITKNSAASIGGGVCIDGWPTPETNRPLIENCLITGNTAAESGGGIASIISADLQIQNCTIADNIVTDINGTGGGLYGSLESDTIVKNSIFWNNRSVDGSQIALSNGGVFTDWPASLTITYSDIQTSAQVQEPNQPIDVVICVDTTGSMYDVIGSIKNAASDIVDRISENTSSYRIAVVDFRNYEVYVPILNYAYKDEIAFSSNKTAILGAINGLAAVLGSGSTNGRTSGYAALTHCIDGASLGNWQTTKNTKKLIIYISDAAPDDPDPFFGYNLQTVTGAANSKNINIYSILTGFGVSDTTAIPYFNSLAINTGGIPIKTPDGNTASAAVIKAIDLATLPSTYIYLDDPQCSIVGLVQDVNGDWTVAGGSNNITKDPNFVPGYLGNYYLSQIQAGQDTNSPCVDAGSGSAISNGMYRHTTRTDHVIDFGTVDMGYHYTLTTDLAGDFNFDSAVNLKDLALLMLYWLNNNCSSPYWCYGTDINEDGRVNFEDFALFAENYGRTETVPPIPDPMTWSIPPQTASPTSVTMTATNAMDNSGSYIEYYFKCVSGGGHDYNWSPNPLYTDTGLTTGVQYGYKVKARDIYHNETGWSVIGLATPNILDITPPTPSPMTWATAPHATSSTAISMVATTATDTSGVEYYFACTAGGGHDSGWQPGTSYTDTGLMPSTTYSYKVQAQDKSSNQNKTLFSVVLSATTPATSDNNAPSPIGWAATPYYWTDGVYNYVTMTALTATDATPPIKYWFKCITDNTYSGTGWQTSTSFTTIGHLGTTPNDVFWFEVTDALGNIGWSTKYDTQGNLIP